MEYRTLGSSDLKVSAITFGAWAIGGWQWGGTDMRAAIEAIEAGLDNGITSIDTAPIYGFGLSEKIVGEALKGKQRDKVQLFTKFARRWDTDEGEFIAETVDEQGKPMRIYGRADKKSIFDECEQSLRRLRTDYIDLYQIHWPVSVSPIEETMEALDVLKSQGKIREAAVCNYKLAELTEAEKTIHLASDQVPYSMVLRDYEKEVVPYCMQNRIGILAYSPLQRGVLTGKFKPDHQFKEGDSRSTNKYYKPENIKRINRFLNNIKPVADRHNATLAQLVLRWTIDQPGITVALAGARDAKQAIQNARAADIKLSKDEMDHIRKELSGLQLID